MAATVAGAVNTYMKIFKVNVKQKTTTAVVVAIVAAAALPCKLVATIKNQLTLWRVHLHFSQ